MSIVLKSIVSMAAAIGGVVAMATLTGGLADVLGGIVVVVGTIVFIRAIMAFAAEPGEARRRWRMPR